MCLWDCEGFPPSKRGNVLLEAAYYPPWHYDALRKLLSCLPIMHLRCT